MVILVGFAFSGGAGPKSVLGSASVAGPPPFAPRLGGRGGRAPRWGMHLLARRPPRCAVMRARDLRPNGSNKAHTTHRGGG